jgi:tetratricopeptide (TPR) repeat protein
LQLKVDVTFLWFRDEFFYLQLALVAFAYLAKEYMTWEQYGRRAHIFNPSAFPLAITSLLLMLTDTIGLTYGLDLIWSFYPAPHFYEVIFLLGLVVQFLFATTPITFGAAATMCLAQALCQWTLGTPVVPQPFDAAVFLGLTLLVTDPVTSPRTATGKLVFGTLYGALVFAAYVVLRLVHEPSYFDKILAVPIVNLLVPWCDAVGRRIGSVLGRFPDLDREWAPRAVLASYVAFFLAISPWLKDAGVGFEDPLPPAAIDLSPLMADLRIRAFTFRLMYPETYAPFTFLEEWRRYCRLSQFTPQTPEGLVALGRVLLDYRRPAEAVSALQTAVRMNPSYSEAHHFLGQALLRQGQTASAVRSIETAVALNPDVAEAQRDLGAALGMERRFDDSVVHLEKALAMNPRDFTTEFNLGGAYLGKGDLPNAIVHLRVAVELKPRHGMARLQLGSALSAQGETDEARRHLQRALALMPRHEGARRLLGEISQAAN